ncbi:MAG: hypothetical protein DCC72_01515 [Burkholderiales bacterium]|nr:MAG: hypothetical protein DCC72_01515 [Burkholderiales bacterium]
MSFDLAVYLPIVVIVVAILATSIRILREYERGVVFTLGRFTGVKGPGLILLLPYVQQMVRVDQRTLVLDVPTQDVISRDNVSVKVNAVIYFRVVQADKAVIQVEDFQQATSQLAQTTLRSVLGKHDLDEMLSERDKLNNDIQDILDAQTDAWGIKVSNVEIKHVDLDESMIRVIARQAEAERERRAKVISAEGEEQAAQKLFEAAEILSARPEAMQLRYLNTLATIGTQNNTTIVFPFPVEFGDLLSGLGTSLRGSANTARSAPPSATRSAPPAASPAASPSAPAPASPTGRQPPPPPGRAAV